MSTRPPLLSHINVCAAHAPWNDVSRPVQPAVLSSQAQRRSRIHSPQAQRRMMETLISPPSSPQLLRLRLRNSGMVPKLLASTRRRGLLGLARVSGRTKMMCRVPVTRRQEVSIDQARTSWRWELSTTTVMVPVVLRSRKRRTMKCRRLSVPELGSGSEAQA